MEHGAVSNAFPGKQGGLRHYTGTIGPVITPVLTGVMACLGGCWGVGNIMIASSLTRKLGVHVRHRMHVSTS